MSAPAPIIQALWRAEQQGASFRMDGVLTVVDCSNVHRHLDGGLFARVSECVTQICHADVLLLNKTDLVTPSALEHIQAQLRTLAPLAREHLCQHGIIDTELLIDLHVFEHTVFKALKLAPSAPHRKYAQPLLLRAGS
eukprot:TRINITY_DN34504_c0_g1_i1.p1 TRINITY_DN34504_c0_g1~~TRINITY_DN34504_c0_g1_i1.p1  ORF type:complete len:138 (+),score=35.62 TRINITY_DN34504_c0_g1_i1:375-788(+)